VNKLFKLKEWLTVPEAAKHLSIILGEEVTEADVLRLALDRHLKLSINLVDQAQAKWAKIVPIEDAQYRELPARRFPRREKGKPRRILRGSKIDDKRVLECADDIVNLKGVYDLLMIGAGPLNIERKYQNLTGGPAITLIATNHRGVLVKQADGEIYQLQDSFKQEEATTSPDIMKLFNRIYYPAEKLPEDTVLVLRTEELRKFEESVNDTPANADKPLTNIERDSLLKLVIGMAVSGYRYAPYAKKNTAVADIAADLALLGLPLGDDTIRKYLKQGNELLPAKPINT